MIKKDKEKVETMRETSQDKTEQSTPVAKKYNVRWQLAIYDLIIFLLLDVALFFVYRSHLNDLLLDPVSVIIQGFLPLICIFVSRFLWRIYKQIWRYGGIQGYVRLIVADFCAFVVYAVLELTLPITRIMFSHLFAIVCTNLLFALALRITYRYAYRYANDRTAYGKFLNLLLLVFAGAKAHKLTIDESKRINIAIIGAGSVGVSLAEELLSNRSAVYNPVCFVDVNTDKVDRSINGIPVLLENDEIFERFKEKNIQEVVFAIAELDDDCKKALYKRYLDAGYKLKIYDYSSMQIEGNKRQMRDFEIEELLFRKPISMFDEKTTAYYKGKVILVTGGGGSIGSEICRQLAKMQPKQIIILDICENGAYDVQQELKIKYGAELNSKIEIVSINNKRGMARVFETYRPQIVINAAAHKHVPLMENNCIEAVENNVFGTKILVDLCEEYAAERFMMVSTDKAVNPTNVMGATKRMCEMIVQSASTYGKVKYSATRFGNVLGSAGSVIPLFKRQIANGGPITITDKRIIRYFMTIFEAVQLVLQSGAMAKNGEIFVLDMGQPVKIMDLAQNMIRLSGVSGVEIVEVGLRPGEKLYEELLIKTEELDKTANKLIFIERDKPQSKEEVDEKIALLENACYSEKDETVRETLRKVVPTYKTPEEVNAKSKIGK